MDITNPQTWNAYGYVGNNPLNAVDPTGMNWLGDLWNTVSGWFRSDLPLCESWGGGDCGLSGNDVGDSNYASWFYSGYDPYYEAASSSPAQSSGGGGSSPPPSTAAPAPPSKPAPAPPSNSDGNQPPATAPATNNTVSATQLLNAIFNRPWVLSWITPIVGAPGIAGVGPAGDIEWDPSTHTACAGIGIGASAAHNAAVGPLTNGKTFTGQTYPNGAKDILAGWSLSGGYNTPALIGTQGMINGSGAAWGPSVGVPGASIASTYSVCVTF